MTEASLVERAPSPLPWTFKEYGYEKIAVLDATGAEVGFLHRRRDARFIEAAIATIERLERALANLVAAVESEPDEFGLSYDTVDALMDARTALAALANGRTDK